MPKKIPPYKILLEEFESSMRCLKSAAQRHIRKQLFWSRELDEAMAGIYAPSQRIDKMALRLEEKRTAAAELKRIKKWFAPTAKKALEEQIHKPELMYMFRPSFMEGLIRSVQS